MSDPSARAVRIGRQVVLALRTGGGAILVSACLAGCGRRTTEADCKLIVDRAVELRMKEASNTDPAAIVEREREVRSALEGEIKDCESRRVTDKTMSCVRAATTTKELDACLH